MIKMTALCASAALAMAQPAAANFEEPPPPSKYETNASDNVSCSSNDPVSYIVVCGLIAGGEWFVKEGYPFLEREVFRPVRDKAVEIAKNTPREVERVAVQVGDEAVRTVENIAKTPRETKRIGRQLDKNVFQPIKNLF